MNEFTLPNGVTIDGILYNKATLDELTGKQQNYLVNTKYKSPVDHIERLLVDLLGDIRDESNTSIFNKIAKPHLVTHLLQIEDIQFLLIKLREITFGERYFFDKIKCSHCGAKNSAELDLSKLEVIHPPQSDKKIYTLPKSGLEIEYKPLNLSELKDIGSDTDRLMNNHMTEACLTVLKRLGDSAPTMAAIESLKAMDTQEITLHAPKYNYLDNQITHTCTSCKKEFDFELEEMSANFFVPSRT